MEGENEFFSPCFSGRYFPYSLEFKGIMQGGVAKTLLQFQKPVAEHFNHPGHPITDLQVAGLNGTLKSDLNVKLQNKKFS